MERRQIESELRECSTINQMIETIDQYYNMDHPLSPIARDLIASKLTEGVSGMITVGRVPKR